MRLYLLRHGDAEIKSSTGKDFDRGLTELGIKQIERVKKRFIQEAEGVEFTVFCSAAKRTRETWGILASAVVVEELEFLDELYLADRAHLLNFLWNVNHPTNDILLIGHNEGISELASYLLDDRYLLPTSGLLVIEFPDAEDLSETGLGTGVKVSKCFPIEE
jgi:phosphohistidine phosphatase